MTLKRQWLKRKGSPKSAAKNKNASPPHSVPQDHLAPGLQKLHLQNYTTPFTGKAFSRTTQHSTLHSHAPWKHGVPWVSSPTPKLVSGVLWAGCFKISGLRPRISSEGEVRWREDKPRAILVTPAGSDCWQTVPPSYTHRDSTISSTAASGRSKWGSKFQKAPFEVGALGGENEGFWAGDRHSSQPSGRSPSGIKHTSAFQFECAVS